jgi:deoxyribodipyrimidine photo-lyase
MVETERLAELDDAPEVAGDYVLYWMQQSQRAEFNPALEVAIAAANRLGLPVLVCFALTEDYPEANARYYAFMLEGLSETERALRARGLGFVVRLGRPDEVALDLRHRAALIICDRGYLRPQREWRANLAAKAGRRVLQVEGDAVVPVGLVSAKPEIGARTFRPKLMRLRDALLRPQRRHTPSTAPVEIASDVDLADIPALLARLRIDSSVAPVAKFRGGYTEAKRHLRDFVARGLSHYVGARARPGAPAISWLSPFLHFGQISPVEVALAVHDAKSAGEDRAAFLDELIVRRELAINFVVTTPNYEQYECLPAWARQTLAAHRCDRREHLYDLDRLARADTHDPYWNAAMREMLCTGFMHNYMRMYWGKKVLEWSVSAELGFANLLCLNNRFFIDGRDANSYANVAWVFGLHDRPWPERPVFGKVRAMAAGGLRRKTDIDSYVRKTAML